MLWSSLSERDSRGAGAILDAMNSPDRRFERLLGEGLRGYDVDSRVVGRENHRSHRTGSTRGSMDDCPTQENKISHDH